MSTELHWGFPVISYLFLAGLGAGALTVSASMFLSSGGTASAKSYFPEARYGALIAPVPVILGTFLLIFELGSFQVGDWFKWIKLFQVINLSPMSIGSWLLTIFIGISLVYAYAFWPRSRMTGDQLDKLRKTVAWIGIPMGIAVAVYTGVLLGAMPSRPFWNTPMLAILFLLSAMSSGVAVIMLVRALSRNGRAESEDTARSGYLLTKSDAMLIGFELLVVFLFIMFAHLTVGDVRHAVSIILFSDRSIELFGVNMAVTFWFWVIVVGLLIPVTIELFYIRSGRRHQKQFSVPRSVEIFVPIAVLVGGFMLRYVVVIAGQVTGSIGI
ncbi:MAG: polysulfide reductase NrfD [Gammaproteobacteria bacterium]|nr:polysulfide reductase NrfD [Gammaproteobacteria bacterium]